MSKPNFDFDNIIFEYVPEKCRGPLKAHVGLIILQRQKQEWRGRVLGRMLTGDEGGWDGEGGKRGGRWALGYINKSRFR